MNARPSLAVDKATFWRFVERDPEGRYEYSRGLIVQQMPGGTLRHSLIAKRIAALVEGQLDPTAWVVIENNRAVETAESIRYPDVVVERLPADLDSRQTLVPLMIVEVLSPTSRVIDLGDKVDEYLQIAALQVYVVADQSLARVRVWLRGADGHFPSEPTIIEGLESALTVSSLGIVVPLAAIYDGLLTGRG
ncbi:MAG TPA: Uma2 family endonuclease [Hyphomicrobiaceae bacterium]|nr:Uma2 family endonuclease [Hyphomicrobiaceae bacterium]